MKRLSFIVSALCAVGVCASLTACMNETQNGKDENIEKSKLNTQIVEEQQDDGECPDGDCGDKAAPDIEMPPMAMPEFRFAPPPEHMPMPDAVNQSEGGDKKPMPKPHKRGEVKPKTPKNSD